MCEHKEIFQLFMEVSPQKEAVSEIHGIRNEGEKQSQYSSSTFTRLYLPLTAAASPHHGAVDADFPETPIFS